MTSTKAKEHVEKEKRMFCSKAKKLFEIDRVHSNAEMLFLKLQLIDKSKFTYFLR